MDVRRPEIDACPSAEQYMHQSAPRKLRRAANCIIQLASVQDEWIGQNSSATATAIRTAATTTEAITGAAA